MSRTIKRIVVKIGSGVIEAHKKNPEKSDLSALVKEMSDLHKKGIEIILVSSGAIVLGMSEMGLGVRPKDLASLQACAAVGQNVLMRTYSNLFEKHDNIKCAQILLTWGDLHDSIRFDNARHTLNAILKNKIIPIINENDTIATEEIKFGDNDKLSAMVAKLIHADRLTILSSGVEGFYNDKKEVIPEIKKITEQIQSFAMDTTNKNVSKGGMITKLEAVKIATSSKIPCVIAGSGTTYVLTSVIEDRPIKDRPIGTYFTVVPAGTYPEIKAKK